MAKKQLYQNDPRWQNEILGEGATETIGYFGCLLTCLAMVGNHFSDKNESVTAINSRFKAVGGFQGPWIRAFKINQVFPEVTYQKHLESNGQPAPLDLISAALAAGSLAVVRVDNSPTAGIQGHWVVIHKKEGQDFLIWDPYNNDKPATLSGRFGFGGTPTEIIQEGILFGTGPLPEDVSAEKTAPAADVEKTFSSSSTAITSRSALGSLMVKPTVDGLTLRRTPERKSGNVVKYLSRTSRLVLSEDPIRGGAKIGQQDQWLQVKDIEGESGYIAAWFITLADEPALGVQSKNKRNKPTPPRKSVVKTTVQSVSLRSAPRIAAETLLKYLPLGTELRVGDAQDMAKIGRQGQWLGVETVAGLQGFVAAWLVVAVQSPAE